jgi:stearoyl-CoA desaturase (delta-9 desaturase)
MIPLFSMGWGAWALVTLALTQVIIALVTVYFHRAVSHRALVLKPVVHRVCRFLSWFLIAMVPQEFAAVHRKHHAKCDTDEDPHSPATHGWHGVVFGGLRLYRKEASNAETIAKYGQGMFADPWEGFYRKFPNLGILLFGALLVLCMGWKGMLTWGLCMAWIPFWAAGVINGLGHHLGYRRFSTEDLSTNLSPWGLWIGGEELHNNHHADPASPKFSRAWYEVDLGWGWIRALTWLGLAEVRLPTSAASSPYARLLQKRYEWLRQLQNSLSKDLSAPLASHGFRNWKQLSRKWEKRSRLGPAARSRLDQALVHPALAQAHQLEQALVSMWQQRRQEAHHAFDEWLAQARSPCWPRVRAWCDAISPPVAA